MPFRRSLIKNSWVIRPQGWAHTTLTQTPIDSFRGVMVLVCLFAVIWVWHLMSVALTAPMDNVEQLVWSHSLEWGYHKHPPLPTWLLALLIVVISLFFGDTIALVHDRRYIQFLSTVWERWKRLPDAAETPSPNVFALGRPSLPPAGYPESVVGQCGWHLGDRSCPITAETWGAVRASAATAAHAARRGAARVRLGHLDQR